MSKTRSNSPQLLITLGVTNLSRIPGTKPKLQILLYSKYRGFFNYSGQLLDNHLENAGILIPPFHDEDWINWNGATCTNLEFTEHILYPEAHVSAIINGNIVPGNSRVLPRYFLARFDSLFLECTRNVSYLLLDLEHPNDCGGTEARILVQGDELALSAMKDQFIALTTNADRTQ